MPWESGVCERFQLELQEIVEPTSLRRHLRLIDMVRNLPNLDATDITCEEVRPLLVDFMEVDLEGAMAARVENHLKTCSDCKSVLDGMRNVAGLLGHLAEFDLPEELRQPRLSGWSNRLRRFDS